MTVIIELPGILTDTSGLQRITTTVRGFPETNLMDLFMFEDNIGVAVNNSLSGRPAGLLEKINPGKYVDKYDWLGGKGGLQIQGTQIVSFPEFDPTEPWSLVYVGGVTGSVSGSVEAITTMIAFRDRSFAAIRGPLLLARAFQNNGVGRHQTRAWQGTVDNTAVDLTPSNTGTVGQRRVGILSYDGNSVVTASLYNKAGVVMTSATVTTTDAGMTTSGSAVTPLVKPAIGISNTTYDGGIQQLEAFARYNKLLSSDEIVQICANASVIGNLRSRPW